MSRASDKNAEVAESKEDPPPAKPIPAKREEKPAPEKSPAPAEHPETLSADHGYPSPRRCPPQE